MNPLYIHECRKKIEREKGLKRVTLSNALSLQKEKADPPIEGRINHWFNIFSTYGQH